MDRLAELENLRTVLTAKLADAQGSGAAALVRQLMAVMADIEALEHSRVDEQQGPRWLGRAGDDIDDELKGRRRGAGRLRGPAPVGSRTRRS